MSKWIMVLFLVIIYKILKEVKDLYFIVSLLTTIVFTLLWIFIKPKKPLHFEYGALIFAGATIAWTVECFKFYMEGDGFIRFDQLWIDTVLGFCTLFFGLLIYFGAILIPRIVNKRKSK